MVTYTVMSVVNLNERWEWAQDKIVSNRFFIRFLMLSDSFGKTNFSKFECNNVVIEVLLPSSKNTYVETIIRSEHNKYSNTFIGVAAGHFFFALLSYFYGKNALLFPDPLGHSRYCRREKKFLKFRILSEVPCSWCCLCLFFSFLT